MSAFRLTAYFTVFIFCAVFAVPFKPAGGPGKQPPCGMPPEERLVNVSSAVREQLIKIWANYANGTDCSAQQRQTKELLTANGERGPKEAAYGGWGGPTFLASASEAVRTAFQEIATNASLNVKEKKEAIDNFMNKQTAELKSAYQKWKSDHEAEIAKWEAEQAEIEKKIAEKLTSASADVKAAYEKMQQIKNNSTLNEEEKWMEMAKYKATLSDTVAEQLYKILNGDRSGGHASSSNSKKLSKNRK